jgi:hypothetical protein
VGNIYLNTSVYLIETADLTAVSGEIKMSKKNIRLILYGLAILLSLSACLPQTDPETAPGEGNATQVVVTTTSIPPIPDTDVVSTSIPGATRPSATITLEEGPHSVDPIEEITVTMEPTVPNPTNPTIEKWIALAKEDLAERTAVAIEDIELVSFESKVWPDPGMGCPQPGMQYKQVPVDGYLIRLRVGEQVYDYHGGGTRPPFLCDGKVRKGDPSVPAPGFDT